MTAATTSSSTDPTSQPRDAPCRACNSSTRQCARSSTSSTRRRSPSSSTRASRTASTSRSATRSKQARRSGRGHLAAGRCDRSRRRVPPADRRPRRRGRAVERLVPGVPRQYDVAVRPGSARRRQARAPRRLGVHEPLAGARAAQPALGERRQEAPPSDAAADAGGRPPAPRPPPEAARRRRRRPRPRPPRSQPRGGRRSGRRRTPASEGGVAPAPLRGARAVAADATAMAAAAAGAGGGGGGGVGVAPYNEALPFIEFVGATRSGPPSRARSSASPRTAPTSWSTARAATSRSSTSADPPPRSAREVLSFGEPYTFVVHAFDTPRRGVDLTMPGVVPAIRHGKRSRTPDRGGTGGTCKEEEGRSQEGSGTEEGCSQEGSGPKKAAAKKAPARKKAAAKKAPAKKKAAAKKAPAKKKAAAKKAPAKKKAAAKKAPAKKKAAAKKAPAKQEGCSQEGSGPRRRQPPRRLRPRRRQPRRAPPASAKRQLRRAEVPPAPPGSSPDSVGRRTGRRRPVASSGRAPRDVERELAQRPPGAGGGVAGRVPARRRLHAGDEAGRHRLPGDGLRRPRLRGGPPRRGAVERRRHPQPRRARRRRSTGFGDGDARRPRGAAAHRHLRRRAGDERLRAQRPRPRPRALPVQARAGSSGCVGHLDAVADPATPVALCGDFNIAPDRPRRVGPGRRPRRHPREPARARGAAAASSTGASPTCSATATPTPSACSRGGTTGPATSTRASACASTSCSARRRWPSAVAWALIDRNARKGKQPSDHAPLVVDLDGRRHERPPTLDAAARPGSPAGPPRCRAARRRAVARRAALLRLADGVRGVLHRLVQTSAPIEVIAGGRRRRSRRLAARLRASYPQRVDVRGVRRGRQRGRAVRASSTTARCSGQANPLAPPIELWLEGDAIVGTRHVRRRLRGPARAACTAATWPPPSTRCSARPSRCPARPGMTGRLTVHYRTPTPLHTELRFAGGSSGSTAARSSPRASCCAGERALRRGRGAVHLDRRRQVRRAARRERRRAPATQADPTPSLSGRATNASTTAHLVDEVLLEAGHDGVRSTAPPTSGACTLQRRPRRAAGCRRRAGLERAAIPCAAKPVGVVVRRSIANVVGAGGQVVGRVLDPGEPGRVEHGPRGRGQLAAEPVADLQVDACRRRPRGRRPPGCGELRQPSGRDVERGVGVGGGHGVGVGARSAARW